MSENIRKPYVLYFDGLCEPVNPGGVACYGWLLQDENGKTVASGKGEYCRGHGATSNVAEWCALGFGLRWISDNCQTGGPVEDLGALWIRGDSQVVIQQLAGKYQCHKPTMQRMHDRCWELLNQIFLPVEIEWIPREENEPADALSREAYRDVTGKDPPSRKSARSSPSGGKTTPAWTHGTSLGTNGEPTDFDDL
jgi:ribonuclease HI